MAVLVSPAFTVSTVRPDRNGHSSPRSAGPAGECGTMTKATFTGDQSAGSGYLENRASSDRIEFFERSTADHVHVTNYYGGYIDFFDSSTAGSATIANWFDYATASFYNNSTADHAVINNQLD